MKKKAATESPISKVLPIFQYVEKVCFWPEVIKNKMSLRTNAFSQGINLATQQLIMGK